MKLHTLTIIAFLSVGFLKAQILSVLNAIDVNVLLVGFGNNSESKQVAAKNLVDISQVGSNSVSRVL